MSTGAGKGKTGPGMLKIPGGGGSNAANRSKISGSTSQNRIGKERNVTLGVGSRTTLSSSRKSQVGIDSKTEHHRLGGKILNIQVVDDDGSDVTPQPLLVVDPNSVKQQQSKLFNAGESTQGTPTDLMSQASIYQTGTTSFAGPFTRSVFGASLSRASSQSNTESFTDEIAEPTTMKDILSGLEDIQTRREETKEDLTEEDLENVVSICLTETPTIWLLDLPGVSVSADVDEAADVKTRNEKYKELCKSRDGNDRYAERGMQTFNDLPKNKEIQTTRVNYVDKDSTVTNWEMYDTYQDLENKEKDEELKEDEDRKKTSVEKPKASKPGVSTVPEEGSTETNKSKEGDVKASTVNASMAESELGELTEESKDVTESRGLSFEEIINLEELKRDLFIMERVITLNTLQHKQAAYRDLPIYPDIDKAEPEETESQVSAPTTVATPAQPPASAANQVNLTQLGPNLDRLWAYSCSLTKGRNVSCMAWNKNNPDLLACGYGQFGFTEQKGGLACCWSLKNPEYPERVFNCEAGVTAMDFSASNPNLLAVGLYNGTVAIYNVRSSSDEPILDSYESHAKHAAPVWQLQWVDKERGSSSDERIEVLVSISTDGRVTQWQIRKGFESAELMKLKKVAKATKKAATPSTPSKDTKEKGEAFISRQAAGLSFDFYPKDSNIYLAGTEDGLIHKCSCSYNEQYLDTYQGHTGPIYKIRWSPFLNDIFLSCSADWSLRLWMQDRLQPVLNFFSSTKAVMDVCWSPSSPTVFGCVNEGAVEIWDLSVNTLDPIIVNVPAPGVKLSCLVFASNSDCILVGDSEGQVSVFQLRCMPPVEEDQTEKLKQLLEQTLAGQLRT
ncbi:dynein axonemal intermediate chain 4-like [Diadema setosum]|uniref:dynein axonemal intermediate chain 4-like n=1 Tax=Diadema setosum TaxID=31175 RepID=UPI003B3AF082